MVYFWPENTPVPIDLGYTPYFLLLLLRFQEKKCVWFLFDFSPQ